jgi:hypothetical protein
MNERLVCGKGSRSGNGRDGRKGADAIADGFRAPGLQSQLDEFETRKASLTTKLAAPAPTTPRLHPNLAEIYRTKVQTLQRCTLGQPIGHGGARGGARTD